MGNRGVITTRDREVGLYLHWNGGRDSVNAFLAYCKMKGYRSPEEDDYGWARLCQVIGNAIGGDLSVGIGPYLKQDRDNFDNGVYIIEDWNVVGRVYYKGDEQDEHPFSRMVHDINSSMPEDEQLDDAFVNKWIEEHECDYGYDVVEMEKDGKRND